MSKVKRFYFIGLTLVFFSFLFGNQFATMQNGENISPGPAAGTQLQPQIAKGGSFSLAVWADRRTVLGRYVPDDNAGIGSDTDIYAARYDAQGNLIDTTPIVIAEAIYEQNNPQVAWNGQNWLVTWITKRRTNQFKIDVLAVRVAPDGRVLDSTPIPIYITPDSEGDPSYLRVSSDGTNWAVVFGQGSFNSSILGVRVAPGGSLIDATPKTLHQDTNFTAPFWADIAYSNNQFLVVWEIVSGSGKAIRAQRFNNNLDAVGSFFTVSLFAGSSGISARVASDGTNYLVIWREERFAYNEIFAARVSTAGQVLDPNGIKLYGNPGDYVLPFNTALTWDGTSYAAAYHCGDTGVTGNICVNRVQTNGTATASLQTPSTSGSSQPAVAALAGGGTKIIWVDRGLSVDGDIFGANFAENNSFGIPAPTSLSAPRQTQIRFTKTDAGNFAYSYRSTISGTSSIYLQRLATNGNAIGEPTLVVQGAEAIFNPSVAWNGSVYLVIWELNGQTFGRIVAADGTLLGAEFLISVGNMPDVAALGTQFLVVNSFPRTSQLRHTQATRVSGNGTAATPVRIGNNFDLRPRVRAFATRWLVVWESDISHDNPNSSIQGAFVEADGTSPGEITFGSFADAPHLAIGGDTALVVWQDGGDIYGRRINSAGVFLDNKFIIAQSPRTLFAAAAAWDGSRFVVTFADSRNSTTLPPPDVWATLVGLDGSLLTPTHFPVAASPLPEEQPSVEAANGMTVFGYSLFENRAPFTSYRIRLRKFPFDTNFSVAVTPYQQQTAPGGTTTFTVNINPQNSFNGEVSLGVYGLPDGASASFNPATITGSGSAILTVTTSTTTPENIYRLTITGTNGAQQSTAEAVLVVDDNPPSVGYAVTDLGTLGGTESAAFDINQSGQIVGYAFNASQKRRAFRYTNGLMQDLGTLGGQTSTAFGINDAGNVVGVSGINSFEDSRAFFYNGSTMQNLGVFEANGSAGYSAAFGINNTNQIVGDSTIVSGSLVAFLFQNNQMTLVGTPFAFDAARDINNAGKIVGSEYVGDSITKSYIIDSNNTNPIYIETLGGRNSYAQAINNNNQVVGSSDYSLDNIFQHAFLYDNGLLRDINGLNAPQSFAYDINDAGLIVGNINLTTFGDPRAFIHDGTTMTNLNSLIPQNSGWVLQEARGINNNGQIVGKGTINNQTRAFLLNPSDMQNTPPTVQIINPQNGSDSNQSGSITISANALDSDGAIVRVEFYAGNVLIGTATSQPYAILWTGAVPNNTYTLTARAFDNSGATAVSNPVTITVGGSPTGTASGMVTYAAAPTTTFVPSTTIDAAGSIPLSTMTDANGSYSLSGFGSGAYTVTPSKSGQVNGISNLDASRIAQHIVGLVELNEFQLMAADTSGNGTVGALDAAYIAQYVASIANPGQTGMWKFLPASRSYTSMQSSQTNQNFSAILVGDVTGNWNPAGGQFPRMPRVEQSDAAGGYLTQTGKAVLKEKEKKGVSVTALTETAEWTALTVDLKVTETTGAGILSYQFEVHFDPKLIKAAESGCELAGTVSSAMTSLCRESEPGVLKVVVFGAAPLKDAGTLLKLKFNVIGTAEKNSSVVRFHNFMFNEDMPTAVAVSGR